ncbi:acylneuraminate cytidylyltransferase family protein [Rhodospirillaceae bacterium AH-315-P19]|nr:acylneuraminate cytidylyltransferase family protein [Rhodospirillaceae bacterium AH-315-P19]
MTRVLGIVPARGGSKRIQDKNIVDFFGRPILAYSLDAMVESGVYEEIHVSTDSRRIQDVVKGLGVDIPFLRGAYAGDKDGVLDVGRWVLDEFERRGRCFDVVGFVMACNPLVEGTDLKAGFQHYLAGEGRPQLAVADYPAPAQQALLLEANGRIRPERHDLFVARSQDLPATVFDTGAFAFFSVESLRNGDSERFEKYRGFKISREKAIDINTLEDLEFARTLFAGNRAMRGLKS